jgi:hypothetical protein
MDTTNRPYRRTRFVAITAASNVRLVIVSDDQRPPTMRTLAAVADSSLIRRSSRRC